jgi:hypothetical protein
MKTCVFRNITPWVGWRSSCIWKKHIACICTPCHLLSGFCVCVCVCACVCARSETKCTGTEVYCTSPGWCMMSGREAEVLGETLPNATLATSDPAFDLLQSLCKCFSFAVFSKSHNFSLYDEYSDHSIWSYMSISYDKVTGNRAGSDV